MRLYTYRIPTITDVISSPGSRTEILYTPKFNGSEIVLFKSGTVDVQDRIDSYGPYCDLRYMLTQLKLGDSSVLSSRTPLFGDFSGFPAHPVDALNFISDVERSFNQLPDDVKASCNNDWRVYFTQLVTDYRDASPVLSPDVSATNSDNSAKDGVNDAT